jgi:hypothetical protein
LSCESNGAVSHWCITAAPFDQKKFQSDVPASPGLPVPRRQQADRIVVRQPIEARSTIVALSRMTAQDCTGQAAMPVIEFAGGCTVTAPALWINMKLFDLRKFAMLNGAAANRKETPEWKRMWDSSDSVSWDRPWP